MNAQKIPESEGKKNIAQIVQNVTVFIMLKLTLKLLMKLCKADTLAQMNLAKLQPKTVSGTLPLLPFLPFLLQKWQVFFRPKSLINSCLVDVGCAVAATETMSVFRLIC